MLSSQECIRSPVSSIFNSGYARGDDYLRAKETWELVTLTTGKKVVRCKWVYIIKLNPNKFLVRLKARLVAIEYSQAYGLNYVNTFSPTAKMTSVRVLVSWAVTYHWPLNQLDIKNVFLNGILDEEVYMEQPPGFVTQWKCANVCKLKKSLYSLKQS